MPEESTTTGLVQLTRCAVEAAANGDYDPVISVLSPDAVWDGTRQGLFVYEGHAAIREFLEEWHGSFDGYSVKVEEDTDLGRGIIFSILVNTGHLKGSSGEIKLRYATIGEWTDGLCKRVATYTDIDEARATAERLAKSRG